MRLRLRRGARFLRIGKCREGQVGGGRWSLVVGEELGRVVSGPEVSPTILLLLPLLLLLLLLLPLALVNGLLAVVFLFSLVVRRLRPFLVKHLSEHVPSRCRWRDETVTPWRVPAQRPA